MYLSTNIDFSQNKSEMCPDFIKNCRKNFFFNFFSETGLLGGFKIQDERKFSFDI
jgi:hypothetical protein